MIKKTEIMRITLLLFVLSAFAFNLKAQALDCGYETGEPYVVVAPSGLTLRAGPSTQSKKLLAMPYGERLRVCKRYEDQHEDKIEGIEGSWVRVIRGNTEGYVFDGFLERDDTAGEVLFVIPNSGIETSWETLVLRKDRKWWAIYPAYTGNGMRVQACPLADSTDESHAHPSARPLLKEAPYLLISGLDFGGPNDLAFNQVEPQMLYPGEQLPRYTYHESSGLTRHVLYAKGKTIASKDPKAAFPYDKIAAYELRIRASANGTAFADELVFSHPDLNVSRERLQPYAIQGLGDLDFDGQLDLLIRYPAGDGGNCVLFRLFLSSKSDPGFNFKNVAMFGDCGC